MTRLVKKEYSPLVIRRYSQPILTFVAIISDDDLDDLDSLVLEFYSKRNIPESIQGIRNLAGELVQVLKQKYRNNEGIAVIIQADKTSVSSLSGDFMNHLACRLELYSLLLFNTQV